MAARHQLRALGVVLAGLGVVVFVLLIFTSLDTRLLAAISATALVLAGVYVTLPASIMADSRYRVQPKFQLASGLVGALVAAALDYAIVGTVDWVIATGVGIGVLIGSGFFRSGTRTRRGQGPR